MHWGRAGCVHSPVCGCQLHRASQVPVRASCAGHACTRRALQPAPPSAAGSQVASAVCARAARCDAGHRARAARGQGGAGAGRGDCAACHAAWRAGARRRMLRAGSRGAQRRGARGAPGLLPSSPTRVRLLLLRPRQEYWGARGRGPLPRLCAERLQIVDAHHHGHADQQQHRPDHGRAHIVILLQRLEDEDRRYEVLEREV